MRKRYPVLMKFLQLIQKISKPLQRNVFASYYLASALLCQKKYPETIQTCCLAFKINEKCADVYVCLSAALCYSHFYEETLVLCQKMNDNQIVSASTLSNKAYALNNLKRYEEAIQECDKALQIEPMMCYAHCNRAQALNNLKRYEEAIQNCEKAIVAGKNDALAYTHSLLKLKKFDEAKSCCETSLSLASNNQNAYMILGLILIHSQLFKEANENFLKALHFNENNQYFYRLQSEALDLIKQFQAAFQSFQVQLESF